MALQEIRQSRGYSQGALANVSGVPIRTIQHYESGHRNINHAQLKTLCTLAQTLNCSIADLLTDEDLKRLYAKTKKG